MLKKLLKTTVFSAEFQSDITLMKAEKKGLSFSSALPPWQVTIYATHGNLVTRLCH